MKRANVKAEMAILNVLCNTKKKERQGELWMRLRAEYFGSDSTRELWDRISNIMDDADALPTFRTLRRDNKLSDAAKALVKGTDEALLTRDETEVTMTQLKDMYILRVCADLNEVLAKTIENSKAPKHELLEKMLEESLFSIRNPEGSTQDILHGGLGGEDSRASDILAGILNGEHAKDRIKTGYGIFDQKSGGFNRGDLVVITANFGGGKSVSALTLFRNMHNFKYSVGLATMEMGHQEIIERLASSVSGVEYGKIKLNQLSQDEKRKVSRAFDKFDGKGSRWSVYSPTNEVTIKDIFRAMSPYQYDVVFIDYIGLLKQVSANKNAREDQILGDAARYCKIMAHKLKCVVVLLAQLNDSGHVMYSKSIAHHANWWWKWQCSEEDKQRGFVTVEQGKARGAECYDFTLTTDFAHMQMVNDLANEGQPKREKKEEGSRGPFRKSDSDPKAKPKLSLMDE